MLLLVDRPRQGFEMKMKTVFPLVVHLPATAAKKNAPTITRFLTFMVERSILNWTMWFCWTRLRVRICSTIYVFFGLVLSLGTNSNRRSSARSVGVFLSWNMMLSATECNRSECFFLAQMRWRAEWFFCFWLLVLCRKEFFFRNCFNLICVIGDVGFFPAAPNALQIPHECLMMVDDRIFFSRRPKLLWPIWPV